MFWVFCRAQILPCTKIPVLFSSISLYHPNICRLHVKHAAAHTFTPAKVHQVFSLGGHLAHE